MDNIFESVLENNSLTPNAWAQISPSQALTWTDMVQLVVHMENKLKVLGVTAGDVVLSSLEPEADWPLSLALAKLGAVSGSVSKFPTQAASQNFWWIARSERLSLSGPRERNLAFDDSWLNFIETDDVGPVYSFAQNERSRLVQTSGTSAEPKLAIFSWGAIKRKQLKLSSYWAHGKKEYNLMGLGAIGGFSTALVSLMVNRPYLAAANSSKNLISFLQQNQVDSLTGSPYQIAMLLEATKASKVRLDSVSTFKLAGGPPNKKLLDSILTIPDIKVFSIYGSTEAGAIFSAQLRQETDVSFLEKLLSGCEALISPGVAGASSEVTGQGYLATKSDSMFDGYLTDEGETDNPMVDGWFYSGDLAKQEKEGFYFLGRESDVLNVGGQKLNATVLERMVLTFAGVEDVLCFEVVTQAGKGQLGMAVVSSFEIDFEVLLKFIKESGAAVSPQFIGRVSSIPRNDMGKPMREKLSRAFETNQGF